ncbi:hypothetical protein V6N13_149113 [Hibiscus sabdariffa]
MGELIALGENGNQSLDCEKVTLLISAKQRNNLDVVLEPKAGREIFLIRIKELGFNIHGMSNRSDVNNNGKFQQLTPERGESSLASTSSSEKENRQSQPQMNQMACSRDNHIGFGEEINAVSMGKPSHDSACSQDVDVARFVGELELVGCRNKTISAKTAYSLSSSRVSVSPKQKDCNWIDVVRKKGFSFCPTRNL